MLGGRIRLGVRVGNIGEVSHETRLPIGRCVLADVASMTGQLNIPKSMVASKRYWEDVVNAVRSQANDVFAVGALAVLLLQQDKDVVRCNRLCWYR